jgi:A/G-specific adenine glycosylase
LVITRDGKTGLFGSAAFLCVGLTHYGPPARFDALQTRKTKAIVAALLPWYAKNARDLPWRHTTDPYLIAVAEIMLQQTQVKAVLPFWERWMRALPDIEAVARAKPEKLHKLWEGLGYYTRVRNLQKAAQVILSRHGGKFPEVFDEVLALPGVGRYTAGAICSIAFDQPTPILDGNVIRVLTRLFGINGNPREKTTNSRLWRLAESLVRQAAQSALSAHHASRITHHVPHPCSHLNQSLMELGALLCTPRQPKCDLCPVARHCLARRKGRVEELPNLGRHRTATPRRFIAFVAQRRGRFLVRQRPAGTVNAHLWEFPNAEVTDDGEGVIGAARRILGARFDVLEPLCTIKHSITRYRITLDVFRVIGEAPWTGASEGRWLTPTEMSRLPFASAHKKVLQRVACGNIPATRSSFPPTSGR